MDASGGSKMDTEMDLIEIEQLPGLTKPQKILGVLFILSILFVCCIFTPLSPTVFIGKVFNPIIEPFSRGQEIIIGRIYHSSVETFLAKSISLIGGCFTGIIAFTGFVGATLIKWRSETQTYRKTVIELQRLQFELEKQRFELEKQRVERRTSG